jgi:hypothetical protein
LGLSNISDSFVNLHNLPKDTFSATDSVQIWLTKLDEWEPSIVNESFELTYNENCCSPVPSELTDRSCNSKYKNFSKEHQINTIFTNVIGLEGGHVQAESHDMVDQSVESI